MSIDISCMIIYYIRFSAEYFRKIIRAQILM